MNKITIRVDDMSYTRYLQIKHLLSEDNTVINETRGRSTVRFTGKLLSSEAQALNNEDIALLVSRGNLALGYMCSRGADNSFSGEYYTD